MFRKIGKILKIIFFYMGSIGGYGADLGSMPAEIMWEINSFLPPKDQVNLSTVNRTTRRVLKRALESTRYKCGFAKHQEAAHCFALADDNLFEDSGEMYEIQQIRSLTEAAMLLPADFDFKCNTIQHSWAASNFLLRWNTKCYHKYRCSAAPIALRKSIQSLRDLLTSDRLERALNDPHTALGKPGDNPFRVFIETIKEDFGTDEVWGDNPPCLRTAPWSHYLLLAAGFIISRPLAEWLSPKVSAFSYRLYAKVFRQEMPSQTKLLMQEIMKSYTAIALPNVVFIAYHPHFRDKLQGVLLVTVLEGLWQTYKHFPKIKSWLSF